MAMILGRDIGIDLGTSSVILSVRGRGIIAREPSVVAMEKSTGRLMKVGMAAERMLGRTPGNVAAIRPIQNGVIFDYDMTERLIEELIKKTGSFTLFKPRLLLSVSSGISEVEERAVIDAAIQAGARKVYLIESAVAAALGAGIDISRPEGHMIVDVGAGTTDIVVVSVSGVVESASLTMAGNAFNDAIIKYIRRKDGVLIGDATAEELKRSIGCVFPRKENTVVEVKGRSLMTGLPRVATISSTDMIEAFGDVTQQIVEAIHLVLENTPPELVSDISENGIVLTGGGSMLWGLDKLIEQSTNIATHIADDAELCVAYGINKSLEWLNDMNDGVIHLSRRRELRD